MTDLSIVTGTYNRLSHLQKMVASCRSSAKGLKYEFVIVDGGSTDGTIGWCKTQRDIVLIEQGELLGAIPAFNAGCYAARGVYVAILNDDIEVVGETLRRSVNYLKTNPWCGQVAYENRVEGKGDPKRARFGTWAGYPYGQCCVTPKYLGDFVGWWGDEGMRTYGGDTRLSLRLWELGYPTVFLEGCAIVDHVVEDELRKKNSGDPWKLAKEKGEQHPDTVIFQKEWRNRLPKPDRVIPAWLPSDIVLEKAHRGTLRTMRFKGMMNPKHKMRTALIDIMKQFGPALQVNQAAMQSVARGDQGRFDQQAMKAIRDFAPDLLILQTQTKGNFTADLVKEVRKIFPLIFIVNFDGDTHYPLEPMHFDMARAVDLQCIPSPTLFSEYTSMGAPAAYWPIGIEREYMIERNMIDEGPDVTFLGTLYGHGKFPMAEVREGAVRALWRMKREEKLDFVLLGAGWQRIGIKVEESKEDHAANAALYAKSKMALSISQDKALWGYTSDRLYNICATGCPALVQRFAGMEAHGFIDAKTCIGWGSFGEMEKKVRYYLNNAHDREMIGAAGKKMTLRRHTWESRVEALFAMIELGSSRVMV